MFSRIFSEHAWVYAFLFLLPLGIKKVVTVLSYPWGDRVVFFYVLDIFIAMLFVAWVRRRGWRDVMWRTSTKALCVFVVVACLSFIVAEHKVLAAYSLFRLLEGVFLYVYVAFHPSLRREFAFRALLSGAVVEMVIGFLQFKAQKSIGLLYLGESVFGGLIPGTATFYFLGQKLVRVPGTFLHPNILGAFLVLSSLIVLYYALKSHRFKEVLGWSVFYYGINLFLLFTFSRSSIATVLFFTLIYFLYMRAWSRMQGMMIVAVWGLIFLTLSLMFGSVLVARFENSFNEYSYKHRVVYNEIGTEVVVERPLLGAGIGNFVSYAYQEKLYQARNLNTSYLYQPIHNLYLLIGSEVGLFGVAFFFLFLFFLFRENGRGLVKDGAGFAIVCIVSSFLILGFADHYFWDLEQGIAMFWTMLGLMVLSDVG